MKEMRFSTPSKPFRFSKGSILRRVASAGDDGGTARIKTSICGRLAPAHKYPEGVLRALSRATSAREMPSGHDFAADVSHSGAAALGIGVAAAG